eukprot:736479-Rhodomonas_salina.1
MAAPGAAFSRFGASPRINPAGAHFNGGCMQRMEGGVKGGGARTREGAQRERKGNVCIASLLPCVPQKISETTLAAHPQPSRTPATLSFFRCAGTHT